ncbi:hypothetical protein HUW48_05040 [Adhaeribacter radiodurans]|uniref:Transposase n=1 Tax=Adhaeribacter radiodurans TaxID=2745197 RepID=A0A7L7L3Q2_9BACT|nr:hypothetical protein [Adhaeribacter radiodurans]QMU27442.1 hypothetical protein HUW48_05040 [Adhaeribacter radiodurans]
MRFLVNFRANRFSDGKSKHDYFQQMLTKCFTWGLRPDCESADSWYASLQNLKFLRKQEVGFLAGLKANRLVSGQPGRYEQVAASFNNTLSSSKTCFICNTSWC